jgi:predicted RNase H-like nuclease (RuvC/YqgF family)
MLTKTELSFLKGLKRFSGMPHEQIEFELTNLIANQKGHKILKKKINELKNKIKKCEKKIEDYKDKLSKSEKKYFDVKIKQDQTKLEQTTRSNVIKTANVHQLKRIELLLKDSKKPLNAREVYTICGMIKEQCVSGLNYLVHHNIIKVNRGKYSG